MKVLIVGAGFSGATVARVLADKGVDCTVIDQRDHLAGNCHTEREEGIMVHKYGPHIFHTDNKRVWQFVNKFADFGQYNHTVVSHHAGKAYPLPMNLGLLGAFFGRHFSPAEAIEKLNSEAEDIPDPKNFEEKALSMMGRKLYEAFFESYTRKQWGRDPKELPASILTRLPFRFNYDASYFNHPYQGIPRIGYTELVQRLLNLDNIEVRLGTPWDPKMAVGYDHVFFSGKIDEFFDFRNGRLPYRTLMFEKQVLDGDAQGAPVINYPDPDVPWTRITEFKHFTPWEEHENTVVYWEYSKEAGEDDIPYYPVRLAEDKKMLEEYQLSASALKKVTFIGRLGRYEYLDMDKAILIAIQAAEEFLNENLHSV